MCPQQWQCWKCSSHSLPFLSYLLFTVLTLASVSIFQPITQTFLLNYQLIPLSPQPPTYTSFSSTTNSHLSPQPPTNASFFLTTNSPLSTQSPFLPTAHMATFLCYMLGMKNKDPTKLVCTVHVSVHAYMWILFIGHTFVCMCRVPVSYSLEKWRSRVWLCKTAFTVCMYVCMYVCDSCPV